MTFTSYSGMLIITKTILTSFTAFMKIAKTIFEEWKTVF